MTDIKTLRALLDKATPRPWTAFGVDRELSRNGLYDEPYGDDAELIAAAINALPSLLADAELGQERQGECGWSLVDEDASHWESSCGLSWVFTDSGPVENGVNFCLRCGKKLSAIDGQREGQ